MKRLKILHLTENLNIGGAQRVIYDVTTNLDKRMFDPYVVTINEDGYFKRRLLRKNINVISLNLPFRRIPRKMMSRLREIINTLGIDIVQTHLFIPNFWGTVAVKKNLNIPVIVTEHGPSAWKKLRHKILDGITYNKADRIVCVCDYLAKLLLKSYKQHHYKTAVIPNGIRFLDERDYTFNKNILRDLDIPQGKYIITSVGRLEKDKNYDALIRAAAMLKDHNPDMIFLIVGGGSQERHLHRLIRRENVEGYVLLLGRRNDVSDILMASNLFVMSSTNEGMPMALLEAGSMAKPCVVTSVGGVPELIQQDKTGILVPPDSYEALALAISIAHETPDQGRGLGKALQEKVKADYSIGKTVQKYHNLYLSVLKKHPSLKRARPS